MPISQVGPIKLFLTLKGTEFTITDTTCQMGCTQSNPSNPWFYTWYLYDNIKKASQFADRVYDLGVFSKVTAENGVYKYLDWLSGSTKRGGFLWGVAFRKLDPLVSTPRAF